MKKNQFCPQAINEIEGLTYTHLTCEQESQEYSACTFELYDKRIQYRTAKITPKKIGLFVTFWKRSSVGPIEPFDASDPFDFLMISASNETESGLFIFPKSVLHEHGCLSKAGKGGKRALRVYPPWSITESKQAQKTQAWQLKYFAKMSGDSFADVSLIKQLLSF